MVIEAKFSSVCPKCNVRIQPRESIEWKRGEAGRHIECPAVAVAEAPAPATENIEAIFRNAGFHRAALAARENGSAFQIDFTYGKRTALGTYGDFSRQTIWSVSVACQDGKVRSYPAASKEAAEARLQQMRSREIDADDRSYDAWMEYPTRLHMQAEASGSYPKPVARLQVEDAGVYTKASVAPIITREQRVAAWLAAKGF